MQLGWEIYTAIATSQNSHMCAWWEEPLQTAGERVLSLHLHVARDAKEQVHWRVRLGRVRRCAGRRQKVDARRPRRDEPNHLVLCREGRPERTRVMITRGVQQ